MQERKPTQAKQSFQARIDAENHAWLKKEAGKQERSANWLLNKVIADARQREGAQQ